jgi:hypothetical protein
MVRTVTKVIETDTALPAYGLLTNVETSSESIELAEKAKKIKAAMILTMILPLRRQATKTAVPKKVS